MAAALLIVFMFILFFGAANAEAAGLPRADSVDITSAEAAATGPGFLFYLIAGFCFISAGIVVYTIYTDMYRKKQDC